MTAEVDINPDTDPIDNATLERADAAWRLKNAGEAQAYEVWLTREIQAALDDSRPSVPHAEVAAEWAVERAVLRKRADRSAG